MRCPVPPSLRPGHGTGFTLIELLLVIVVLGIAANMVVPMLDSAEPTRLRQAARMVEADLAAARIGSITHADDPCVVAFDPSQEAYHVARQSEPETPMTNPADRRPYRVAFGQGRAGELGGVRIESVSVGDDQRLGFGGYGQLDQSGEASITLATEDHRLELTVDPTTGRVSIGQIE